MSSPPRITEIMSLKMKAKSPDFREPQTLHLELYNLGIVPLRTSHGVRLFSMLKHAFMPQVVGCGNLDYTVPTFWYGPGTGFCNHDENEEPHFLPRAHRLRYRHHNIVYPIPLHPDNYRQLVLQANPGTHVLANQDFPFLVCSPIFSSRGDLVEDKWRLSHYERDGRLGLSLMCHMRLRPGGRAGRAEAEPSGTAEPAPSAPSGQRKRKADSESCGDSAPKRKSLLL